MLEKITADSAPEDRLPLIITRLRAAHPDARCALEYQTPLQLLVATILSAQCTDVRVNMVTPVLFARFPDAAALACANRTELEALIRSTGFYRQKARYIRDTAVALVNKYGGEVPDQMEALLAFPGVARKTANVILGEIFDIAAGIVVDTHVKRLAQLLTLTENSDPRKVEQDLMLLVPRDYWIEISHLLIFHGRRICIARRPKCAECTLNALCPSAEVV